MTGSENLDNLPAVIGVGTIPALVNPHTGEVTELANVPTDTIARWLALYRATQDVMKDGKRAIDAEMCVRADYDAQYHIDVEGVGRITVDGPADEEVWDLKKLKEVLDGLVKDKEISESAATAALEPVITLKVRANGIKALRKRGGHIEASINACRELHPPVRYANLKAYRQSSPS